MNVSGASLFGIIVAMVAYLLGMLTIGFLASRKNETVGDFYLGGRKLGPFVTAMSAEASDMSSWLLMGLPGLAYLSGIAEPVWTAVGLAVGTYINWLIVAKRLRRYSLAADNAITIPQFFSNRYRDRTKILTLVSALIIVIFFIPYTASGFAAIGKLFASLFYRGELHRSDPEHYHDDRARDCPVLRGQPGRRMGCCHVQRQIACRPSFSDDEPYSG